MSPASDEPRFSESRLAEEPNDRNENRFVGRGDARRIVLRDGKVLDQRDYYDLWGDILDNIPFVGKLYRLFMRKRFG